MKKKSVIKIISFVFLSFMIINSCNTGDVASGDSLYTLTVSLSTGVVGTPAAGSFNYSSGSVISYNYTLESNSYINLQVTIDGNPVGAAGSITMDRAHTLDVTADFVTATYDVRGNWVGTNTDSNGDPDPFDVTFSGTSALSGTTSGWVDDPSSGGTGTYSVTGISIEFSLWYGSVRNFQVTGSFSNQDQMSGSWVWTNQSGDKFYGTWILNRN